MKTFKLLTHFLFTFWLCFILLFGSQGCRDIRFPQDSGMMPLFEQTRAKIGIVGIARAQFQPKAKFETFASGKGAGAAKGAIGGALEGFLATSKAFSGASCEGWICGAVVIVYLGAAAVGTTVGAVYGAVKGHQDAVSSEEIEKAREAAKRILDNLMIQDNLRDAVLHEVNSRTKNQTVNLTLGPISADDKVNYSYLKSEGIDSVLDLRVTEIGFQTPPREVKYNREDPPLYLTLKCSVQLIQVADGNCLYESDLEIRSYPLRRSEWDADGSKAFFDELAVITETLAEKIVDDIFITSVLPIFPEGGGIHDNL